MYSEKMVYENKIKTRDKIIEDLMVDNMKLLKIGNIMHNRFTGFELSDSYKVELIKNIIRGEWIKWN